MHDDNEGKPPYDDFDAVIALLCDNTRASSLYYRFKFMVGYLEADKGMSNVGAFIKAIEKDTESHWEVVPQNEQVCIFKSILPFVVIHWIYQVKSAWQLLWNVLHFHNETDHQANTTFKEQIDIFFPPLPNGILEPTSFSVSLKDLESADLRVKPTRNFYEHLLIEKDIVNIYHLRYEDIKSMLNYENNRAAKYVVPENAYLRLANAKSSYRALGIANLGDEIRASLYALYGRDELHSKAGALEIFTPENEQRRLLCARFLELSADTQPAVCNL